MSAYEQDSMCSDTSACALGTCVGTVADMSACALGSDRVCKGTTHPEMLSQLKGLTNGLLSRQGVEVGTAVPSTAPMSGEASASSTRTTKEQRAEMEKIRETMERSNSLMEELLSQHRTTGQRVKELADESKSVKWQLQEMQEEASRGRDQVNERLSVFADLVSRVQEQEQLCEVLEDNYMQVNASGEEATAEEKEQDNREREEYLRSRKEEAEHRREGHLRGTTSRTTSPTRRKAGKEEEEEFSDKGYFEKVFEQEQEYEDYMGNVSEMYTQSYTGPTENEYPEEEEEEEEKEELTEEEKKKLEEEEEQERKRKIREINQKSKERATEKEKRWKDSNTPTTTAMSGRSTPMEDTSTGSTE
eukprot:s3770_g8.t1